MNRNGFDIGEYVSYGINGMCNIEDIRPMQLSQSVEKMMYYIPVSYTHLTLPTT